MHDLVLDPIGLGPALGLASKSIISVSYTHLVLTRDEILPHVWGYEFDGESRTVDVHIRTLRAKLGDAGKCIETVRGLGYKIGGGND